MMSYLIKGITVGLVFGVPAGAIGALTIQRSLAYGFWAGLLTGLGSSAADVLYACVGVFGLTIISDLLVKYETAIALTGGILIMGLGILIFRKKGMHSTEGTGQANLWACFASSFVIAIANPATILSFLAAFASFGIGAIRSLNQGAALVAGILLGTGCWWTVLAGLSAKFRKRVTECIYEILNRLLGALMMLFGIGMVLRSIL